MPKVTLADKVITFDREADHRLYVAALDAGRIIVANNFKDDVGFYSEAIVYPDKIIEERRSAHGVAFGKITGRPKPGCARRSVTSVALKPFMNPTAAVHEMAGYLELEELGITTFQPIGIFPAEEGDHVIGISVKNNDLQSLDRGKWVVGRAVTSIESMLQAERNNRQITGIAEATAYINAHGLFHLDGQIKNFATTASDQIGIIDTEGIIKKPLGDTDTLELAWDSLNKLTRSLILHNDEDQEGKIFGVGMLANLPMTNVRSSLSELMINPYLEKLASMLDGASPDMAGQIEILYDGIQSRFENETEWPGIIIAGNAA